MHTERSASATCSESASAFEYTATVSMPSSFAARIMRTAISPRFAIIILRIIRSAPRKVLDLEQRLVELDHVAVVDEDAYDLAVELGLERVHHLHCLDD